jgi:spoIIIJ-associated protein
MSEYFDFYEKDAPAAIAKACQELNVGQEQMRIEVLETGTTGIFGLCRKKAHIRVWLKKDEGLSELPNDKHEGRVRKKGEKNSSNKDNKQSKTKVGKDSEAADEKVTDSLPEKEKKKPGQDQATDEEAKIESTEQREENREEPVEVSPETLDAVKVNLEKVCELMEYPATATVALKNNSLECHLSGEYENELIGQEGRVLDAIQYLVRKMISLQLPEQVVLNLDAGNFRQRRLEELKEQAIALADKVRENGKTLAIPALNPSERRMIHMLLQDDKSIRSRSVGDGLFKKVLIYKPGKGRKSSSRKRKGGQKSGDDNQ